MLHGSFPGVPSLQIYGTNAILKDCEMPIMNGIDATKEIRRMQAVGVVSRHLPILGVSANVRGPKGRVYC